MGDLSSPNRMRQTGLRDRFGATRLCFILPLETVLNIGLEFALRTFDGLQELRAKREFFQKRADRPEFGLQVDRCYPTCTVWTQFFQPPSSARFLDEEG